MNACGVAGGVDSADLTISSQGETGRSPTTQPVGCVALCRAG